MWVENVSQAQGKSCARARVHPHAFFRTVAFSLT